MSYTLNHNFFDEIDTEEKAYFLGLMFSDGCVQSNGSSWRIRIGLHSKDTAILEKYHQCISYTGPLRKTSLRTHLDFSSKNIGEALVKHGCIPNKSLVLEYPKTVPNNLIWHFIRGYFDGDGCLCVSGRGARWTLVGTNIFLSGIAERLAEIKVNCSIYAQRNSKVYILSVSGNKQIHVLLKRLYQDAIYKENMTKCMCLMIC